MHRLGRICRVGIAHQAVAETMIMAACGALPALLGMPETAAVGGLIPVHCDSAVCIILRLCGGA